MLLQNFKLRRKIQFTKQLKMREDREGGELFLIKNLFCRRVDGEGYKYIKVFPSRRFMHYSRGGN